MRISLREREENERERERERERTLGSERVVIGRKMREKMS